MLKTLAAKHKSSVAKMAARYKAKVITGHGPRTCFEARLQREGKKDLVARFGGILWVPTISSTSRDQAIFVDRATGASLSSHAVLPENDRLW